AVQPIHAGALFLDARGHLVGQRAKVAGLFVDLRVQAGEDHISGHGKPPLLPFFWVDVAQSTPDFGWMMPRGKRLRHYYVSRRRPQGAARLDGSVSIPIR